MTTSGAVPTGIAVFADLMLRVITAKCRVGKRNLRTDETTDASGNLRLIFRTPNWDDFVDLKNWQAHSRRGALQRQSTRARQYRRRQNQRKTDYRP